MFQSVAFVLVTVFAVVLTAPAPDTEFVNINSRVPGDELIWESSKSQQNLDFYGKLTYEISFPLNGSRSNYIITHIHVDAKENTGLLDFSVYGGPGTDFARIRMISNSVKVGNYKIYIYGKKK